MRTANSLVSWLPQGKEGKPKRRGMTRGVGQHNALRLTYLQRRIAVPGQRQHTTRAGGHHDGEAVLPGDDVAELRQCT